MPTATPIRFDSGDSFRIVNEDEHTITLTWAGKSWTVEPNGTAFVPFDVIRLHFGDPRSIMGHKKVFHDSHGSGTIPPRENELFRLATLYGCYTDKVEEVPNIVPKVRVELSDGTPVSLPAFDPEGGSIVDDEPLNVNNMQDLVDVVEAQRRQLKKMETLLEKRQKNGDNSGTDVTVDGDDGTRFDVEVDD